MRNFGLSRKGWTTPGRPTTFGIVGAALLIAACSHAEPVAEGPHDTSADASGTQQTDKGELHTDDPRCATAERVEAAFASLLEDGFEAGFGFGDDNGEGPSPAEVRDGVLELREVADALDGLAATVTDEFRPLLEQLAQPHRDLAEIYADVDFDFERLESLGDPQLAQLSDAALGVLLGPDWSAADEATFETLIETLREICPGLDLEIRPTADERPATEAPSDTPGREPDAAALLERANRIHDLAAAGEPAGGGRNDNACTLVDWPQLRSVVAGLPDPERVRVESHGQDHAGCGFGGYAWRDPSGNRLETSAAIVELGTGVPDLDDARRTVSPAGRDVIVGTSSLGALTVGGHGREKLAVGVAVHEVGEHRVLALVHASLTDMADPLDLVDAAADDLSLP